ncbi:hypothetical protein D9M72_574240 [compost metagenome]
MERIGIRRVRRKFVRRRDRHRVRAHVVRVSQRRFGFPLELFQDIYRFGQRGADWFGRGRADGWIKQRERVVLVCRRMAERMPDLVFADGSWFGKTASRRRLYLVAHARLAHSLIATDADDNRKSRRCKM